MRFSTISLLALPLLAAAQESPLDQVKAQAQSWFSKLSSYVQPEQEKPVVASSFTPGAVAAKVGALTIETLELGTWEQKIRGSVSPGSLEPEEWWVLITGGNKSCYGLCHGIESAYNKSALLFAVDPTAPHLAMLNCDAEPVLCNSWATAPQHLYIMSVPSSGPVDVWIRQMNASITEGTTYTTLHSTKSYKEEEGTKYEGIFHPFDGKLAELGLAVPWGYVLYYFGLVPSWVFMIGVSYISRSIVGRRTARPTPGPGAATPASAPAADVKRVRLGAPPGDGNRNYY